MTSSHFTLYKSTTTLSLHQEGLASYVVYITTTYSYDYKYKVLQRQRQHTYIQDMHTQFKICHQRKACALKRNKYNCHSYKAYAAKFQQKRKKIKTKAA